MTRLTLIVRPLLLASVFGRCDRTGLLAGSQNYVLAQEGIDASTGGSTSGGTRGGPRTATSPAAASGVCKGVSPACRRREASVVSGYAGGSRDRNYQRVSCTGSDRSCGSGARSPIDPAQASYDKLLQIYFSVAHDPTR